MQISFKTRSSIMVIDLIRKWTNKSGRFSYGQDNKGNLYCKDNKTNTTLVCVDSWFKKNNHWYYKFINPETKKLHYVRRK